MRIGLIGVGRIGAFHASTLRRLPQVDSVIITDVNLARAQQVAGRFGLETADSVQALLTAGIQGLVVVTATSTHPGLIRRGVEAGIPVFCEKPVAADVDGTLDVIKHTTGTGVPVQIGFQRRFDAGHRAVRDAARSGSLGWAHTVRSTTFDRAPPPADYIRGSGGIYRDCAVHDFDAIRWVTGSEVGEVYAAGVNRGEEFFAAAGDVDTASALLTLDDGTLATVSSARHNWAGYDMRLEVFGSGGSISAGLDDRMPLRSAQPGVSFPAGTAYPGFMERFRDAYEAELTAFTDLAARGGESPCTMQDALEAFYIAEACELSRRRRAPVAVAEVR